MSQKRRLFTDFFTGKCRLGRSDSQARAGRADARPAQPEGNPMRRAGAAADPDPPRRKVYGPSVPPVSPSVVVSSAATLADISMSFFVSSGSW